MMNSTQPVHTALVTGATGFVGSRLVRRLLQQGWAVHIVVRPSSQFKELQDVKDKIHIHAHDGSTDNLVEIVRAAKPELVFHLASLFLSSHRPADIIPLFHSNVVFGAQLLEAMNLNGIRKLINTGTFSQHYQNKDYSPALLYDTTKKSMDDIVQFYHESASFSVITLELFDSFGPGDPRRKLFWLLRNAATTGKTLDMSPGEQLINCIYVDDTIDGYLAAAKRLLGSNEILCERFALSGPSPMPLREIVALYEKVAGRKVPVNWGGRQYRPREIMVPWNQGRPLPGWKPRFSLEEGIRLMEQSHG